MSDTEVELKLLAPTGVDDATLAQVVRDAGFTLGPGDKRRQVDRYLDTESMDLARRGIALRRRQHDEATVLCVKMEASTRGLVWRRVEVEEAIAASAPLPGRASELPGALRHRVEPFALARPLHELVRLETERTRYGLRAPLAGSQAELSIDRVRVHGPGDASFVEIEIELEEGPPQAFESLAAALRERLGLVPSQQDKLSRAVGELGIPCPPAHAAAPVLDPALPFRFAATRVFRTHLEALRRAEPEARLGDDIEGVHDVRVASRRLRAAFRIFRDAFPRRRLAPAIRLIRETGRALGPVRDLDVMIASLGERSAELPVGLSADLAPLAQMLVGFRERERRRMLRFLGSRGRLRAMERLEELVSRLEAEDTAATFDREVLAPAAGEAPPPPGRARRVRPGDRPTGEVAPELLRATVQRVLKRGDRIERSSPPLELHALRIAVKRMRYTAEAFTDLYGRELRGFLRQSVELQDLLGAFNDAGVAAAHLAAWIDTREGRRLPRRTLVATGALIGAHEARGREARAGFRKAWKAFSRAKVRRSLAAALGESPTG